MDHAPADKEHIANATLGQGVGYGIVVGLGGAFALGKFSQIPCYLNPPLFFSTVALTIPKP